MEKAKDSTGFQKSMMSVVIGLLISLNLGCGKAREFPSSGALPSNISAGDATKAPALSGQSPVQEPVEANPNKWWLGPNGQIIWLASGDIMQVPGFSSPIPQFVYDHPSAASTFHYIQTYLAGGSKDFSTNSGMAYENQSSDFQSITFGPLVPGITTYTIYSFTGFTNSGVLATQMLGQVGINQIFYFPKGVRKFVVFFGDSTRERRTLHGTIWQLFYVSRFSFTQAMNASASWGTETNPSEDFLYSHFNMVITPLP